MNQNAKSNVLCLAEETTKLPVFTVRAFDLEQQGKVVYDRSINIGPLSYTVIGFYWPYLVVHFSGSGEALDSPNVEPLEIDGEELRLYNLSEPADAEPRVLMRFPEEAQELVRTISVGFSNNGSEFGFAVEKLGDKLPDSLGLSIIIVNVNRRREDGSAVCERFDLRIPEMIVSVDLKPKKLAISDSMVAVMADDKSSDAAYKPLLLLRRGSGENHVLSWAWPRSNGFYLTAPMRFLPSGKLLIVNDDILTLDFCPSPLNDKPVRIGISEPQLDSNTLESASIAPFLMAPSIAMCFGCTRNDDVRFIRSFVLKESKTKRLTLVYHNDLQKRLVNKTATELIAAANPTVKPIPCEGATRNGLFMARLAQNFSKQSWTERQREHELFGRVPTEIRFRAFLLFERMGTERGHERWEFADLPETFTINGKKFNIKFSGSRDLAAELKMESDC